MSGLGYLGVAVAMAVVLSTLLWLAQRKPTSFMSSIDEFRSEMDALSLEPRSAEPAGRRRTGRGQVRPEPIVPAPRHGDLARKLRAARQHRGRATGSGPSGGDDPSGAFDQER
jgi:hypothetical protein